MKTPLRLPRIAATFACAFCCGVAGLRAAGDSPAQIVGNSRLEALVEAWGDLAAGSPSGRNWRYRPSDDLAALQSLAYGTTRVAPVATEFLSGALGPYRIIAKAEPFGIRVAHASAKPGAGVSPLVIVVNPANPLAKLSTGQLGRIFTSGGRMPALTHWGQLGLNGVLERAEIHPVGLPESDHYASEDESFAECFFVKRFDSLEAAWAYRRLPTYAEVTSAVASDPDAIGVTALSAVTAAVRVVPLADGPYGKPSVGDAADRAAGKYALDRYVYLYIRRSPGKPIDADVRALVEAALSPAGQAAIGADGSGYLPLNPTEIGEERAKLE